MTKFGETAEKILQIINKNGKVDINELEKKVPSANKAVLDLLKEIGLIEIEESTARITDFGLSVLTEE